MRTTTMMEVEQKFLITAGTRRQLESLGGHRTATEHIHDVYYDTVEHSLMMRDHWLRQRDGRWELKYQHHTTLQDTAQYTERLQDAEHYTERLQGADQYTEETDENLIFKHLEEEFRIQSQFSNNAEETRTSVTLETLLECSALVPVVKVNCVRESYVIRDGLREGVEGGCETGDVGGEVRVDLDECVWCGGGGGERRRRRYGVGEVEIMVASPDQVRTAAQRCRDLALKLGKCAKRHC